MIQENELLNYWADALLLEHEAICECPLHDDVLTDNLDPGAVEEVVAAARRTPPQGLSPDEAADFVNERLNSIGDECGWCAKNAAS